MRMKEYNIIEDLENVITKYPTLKIEKRSGILWLNGDFILLSPCGDHIDSFCISICFFNFPNQLPMVWENGGKIERIPDRHVYTNTNSLCLAVEPTALLICNRGINALHFIEKILKPHLAMQAYFNLKGVYPTGEYKHGFKGILEYLSELLGTDNTKIIASSINIAIENVRQKNHEPCYCGSRKKFKNCHLHPIKILRLLGNDKLEQYLKTIQEYGNKNNTNF